MPAAIYVETQGGIAIGGSDDHAGIDIGRTFTRAPAAATPGGVPRARARRPRRARAASRAAPRSGRTPRWRWRCARSAATASARRSIRCACSRWPSGCWREGDRREGAAVGNLAPADARALLRAWLASVGSRRPLRGRPRRLHAGRAASPTRTCTAARRGPTSACCARPSRPPLDAAGRGALGGDRRRAVRGLHPGDPVRAVGRVHRARAREALEPRRRAAASRDRRRRHRRDARRHAHDRGDSRTRHRRLRDRGDRHRPQRRPAARRPSPTSRSRTTRG